MFPKALNQHLTNDLPRCQYQTGSGRCRRPLTPDHATLCPRHAATQRDDSADLSALLSQNLSQHKSAADVHAQLWNLSLVLQQGRISPRRAAVLAYIGSLLLRTLPAIEKLESPENEGMDITGAPRPIRDNVETPRPTHYFDDPPPLGGPSPNQPCPTQPQTPPPHLRQNSSASTLPTTPQRRLRPPPAHRSLLQRFRNRRFRQRRHHRIPR
jgi:hypothetical protein